MSLRSVSLRSVSLRSVSLRSVSLRSVSLRSVSLRSVSLRSVSLRSASPRSVSQFFFCLALRFDFVEASRACRLASYQSLFQLLAHRGEVGIEASFASDQNDTARGRACRRVEKGLVQQGTQASFGTVACDRFADLAACRDAEDDASALVSDAPREVEGGIRHALDDEERSGNSAGCARGLHKLCSTQHANGFRQHRG